MRHPRKLDVIGNVESCDHLGVKGWALCRHDPQRPVIIGVFDEKNDVLAVGHTGVRRDDVEAIYGSENAGFLIALPRQFGKTLRVMTCLQFDSRANWSQLGNAIEAPKQVFYLDEMNRDHVSGWIFSEPGLQASIEVGFRVGETIVATTRPSRSREDVARAHGVSSETGFHMNIPYKFSYRSTSRYQLLADVGGARVILAAGLLETLPPPDGGRTFAFDETSRAWKVTHAPV